MDLRDSFVVAGGQAVENLREPKPRLAVDAAHYAEIDRHNRSVGADEQIALVHVGVEKAFRNGLAQEDQDQLFGECVQVMPGCLQRLYICDFDAVDPVERQHAARCPVPVDVGDHIAIDRDHGVFEFRRARGFAAQIEFAQRPAFEVGDDQLRTQPRGLSTERLQMCRRPLISFDIAGKLLAYAGTQHLDRNIFAFGRPRAVDLGNGGGTDRHRVDIFKQLGCRFVEAGVNFDIQRVKRRRRQLVLQRQQIMRGLNADDVRPRCQRLAELDRGRADGLKRTGIIRNLGLDRAQSRNPAQALHRWRRIAVSFDSAQRAVPGEDAAPFEQAEDVGCGACHERRGAVLTSLSFPRKRESMA